MNMTYARAKFRLNPQQKAKVLADLLPGLQVPMARLTQRVMVVSNTAATLPPSRREKVGAASRFHSMARRHRLNPGRRTVEENRSARQTRPVGPYVGNDPPTGER